MGQQSYYGIVGNGETCALISSTGSIDWFCLPSFDGNMVFSKALNPNLGESFYIELFDGEEGILPKKFSQSYIKNTNILVTEIEYKPVKLKVIDFMPWKGISESIREKRYLFRILEVQNKTQRRKSIKISLSTEKGGEIKERGFIEDKNFALGVYIEKNTFELKPKGHKETFIVLSYGETRAKAEYLLNKAKRINIRDELAKTENFWKNWLARGYKISFKDKDYEDMYSRSLLVCKLLTYLETGAFLAAPTASFPVTPSTAENWDYRFCWLRDSYFVSRAFLKTGHYEEVRDLLEFFYSIQESDGSWLPLYTISGKKLRKEVVIEAEGKIIRMGNAAKNQLQLDNEGSVLHTTYLYYLFTKEKSFLREYWKKIVKAADWISKNYQRPENGLWELREKEHRKKAQWVYGKVMCYVGLESAIKIGEVLEKKLRPKWEMVKNSLKNDILKEGWSNQRKSFLQLYDADSQIDISVLAIEDYGLLSPLNPKIRKTVQLIEEKLVTKGFGVKRFEDANLPFYLPTLWLATHYIRAGDKEKAKKYIAACIRSSTNLYLCAEHFDPIKGEQHGNFPQAFNHSMFVETLLCLKEEKYALRFLNVLNIHFKTFLSFLSKVKPKKGFYLRKK
ncbi:glycoside hydrolase family 15 protein [Patescibacteria group bacterium]|nr:glycoside hydrolase family 15 protein [Patescibacteria group bacterium]